MNKIVFLMLLLMSNTTFAVAETISQKEAESLVKQFWSWTNKNGEEISASEPKVKVIKHKFVLEKEKIPIFISNLEKTNLFSNNFKTHVSNYYIQVTKKLNYISKKEIKRQEKEGFEILFDFEDMDMVFCAQEYNMDERFINSLKVKNIKQEGKFSTATIYSSYGWNTPYTFIKEKNQWKIEKYCVF